MRLSWYGGCEKLRRKMRFGSDGKSHQDVWLRSQLQGALKEPLKPPHLTPNKACVIGPGTGKMHDVVGKATLRKPSKLGLAKLKSRIFCPIRAITNCGGFRDELRT